MQRDLRRIGSVTLLVLGVVVLQQAAAGCSSSSSSGECSLAPPGKTFTFHVQNTGTTELRLARGCGKTPPIDLTTPKGEIPIGPGSVVGCGFTCEEVYDPDQYTDSCLDCGPGSNSPLGPGMTADLQWDRRVYVEHKVDPGCVEDKQSDVCALGEPVAPSSAQEGVLTVCASGSSGSGGIFFQGACPPEDATKVPFAIDTTGDEGTIEVK